MQNFLKNLAFESSGNLNSIFLRINSADSIAFIICSAIFWTQKLLQFKRYVDLSLTPQIYC